ncbi:hypothetical protein K1T73_10455 [Roseovarius sp. SCSIO 43702]|uniref:hypothetical protein n=1 Tax=Roseovarius sp. SCSIO 43702 TaxID=2823043 RepID=UPI001C731BF0|nr:hypothetical protein [Roseovarius sp. SCSIO 43702]QYX55523.1 hypothetical protein K1T73_10455 [Roseovarius sp. SCSIO 43702]
MVQKFSRRMVFAPPLNAGGSASCVLYSPMRLCSDHTGLAQGVLQAIGEKAYFGNSGVLGFEKREASGIFPRFIEHMLEKEHIAQLEKQGSHAARQPARLAKPVEDPADEPRAAATSEESRGMAERLRIRGEEFPQLEFAARQYRNTAVEEIFVIHDTS